MVTFNRQSWLSNLVSNAFNYGQLYPTIIICSIIIYQLTATLFSVPLLVNIVMLTSISLVWIDGLSTNIGLNRGLEESNQVIRLAQRKFGDLFGLFVSRLLPLSIIMYIGIFIQSYFLIIPMIIIFTACIINNIFRLKNPK